MLRKVEDRAPRVVAAQPYGPAAAITRRAADRLRAGHLWVYRSDVESLIPPLGATEIAAGALVTVMDSRGIPLGSGLYSAASQIAVRIVSTEPSLTREAYLDQLRERVVTALALRDEVAPESMENDAHRLIFSEADNLPGIVADRYNDLVILQLLTQGTAQDDVRRRPDRGAPASASAQTTAASPYGSALIQRSANLNNWPRQLQVRSTQTAPNHHNSPQSSTINGLQFHFDAGSGQKTGAFLDQRLNYAAAATIRSRPTRSTSAPTRAASPSTSRRSAATSLASTPAAARSK